MSAGHDEPTNKRTQTQPRTMNYQTPSAVEIGTSNKLACCFTSDVQEDSRR